MAYNIFSVTFTSTATIASDLIQEAHLDYVVSLVSMSMFALLVYTVVLSMPRGVTYVWLSPKPLSVPNLLYACTKYGILISQGTFFWLSLVRVGRSPCNDLNRVTSAAFIVGYTGIQGMLILRAYALCQGNKVIVGPLALLFIGGFILNTYHIIMSNTCQSNNLSNQDAQSLLEVAVANICVIMTDFIVFCVCFWKVWGIWKMKRQTGIQNNNDLVSIILKQSVSRVCLVILLSVTVVVLELIPNTKVIAIDILGNLQHSFSAILLTEFTLDLRQRNSPGIQSTNETISALGFRDMGRLSDETSTPGF